MAPKKRRATEKRVPQVSTTEAVYPMRINKYLAVKGFATRKDADLLIEKGQVSVNGERAQVGMSIAETDTVEVKTKMKSYVYLACNKPVGLSTLANEKSEKDILSLFPSDLKRLRLFPLGRLDKASSGLILVTNDARVTDRLLNPKYDHEKTYVVTTKDSLRASFKEYMEKGVNIEGYETKPTQVSIQGEKQFEITLKEGKRHQIRRMVVAMHNEVRDLKRTKIMNIALGKLAPGAYRRFDDKELNVFLTSLGL